MRASPRLLPILGSLLLTCTLFSAGCSALIAYSGQDVQKLANKDQVHKSFGTPNNSGTDSAAPDFEEFRTHRKSSEPTVAGVSLILAAETLGLLELWMFPAAVLENAWTTVFGQTVRFEYAANGDVQQVLINGTSMNRRAQLP